jgi:hypothetical protein
MHVADLTWMLMMAAREYFLAKTQCIPAKTDPVACSIDRDRSKQVTLRKSQMLDSATAPRRADRAPMKAPEYRKSTI